MRRQMSGKRTQLQTFRRDISPIRKTAWSLGVGQHDQAEYQSTSAIADKSSGRGHILCRTDRRMTVRMQFIHHGLQSPIDHFKGTGSDQYRDQKAPPKCTGLQDRRYAEGDSGKKDLGTKATFTLPGLA